MDEAERLITLIASDWKTIVLLILLFIFVLPELVERIDKIKQYFGIMSSQERRFSAIEERQNELIEENKRLQSELSKAEKRCEDEIKETETKFDKREHDHWAESKVIRHDLEEKVVNLDVKIDMILQQLQKKESLDFKKLRNQIVELGEAAIERGHISIRKLKSLEELYAEYTDKYDGNSYAETLMVKVRKLDVVGKLNEYGEDIE